MFEILEYPVDSASQNAGKEICGSVEVSFLDESGISVDISLISFLTYDIATKTLAVQSYSY